MPAIYYEQQPAVPIADEPLLDVSLKQKPEGSVGDPSESSSSDGMQEKSAYVEKVVFSVHIYLRACFLRQQYFKTKIILRQTFLRQFF